MDFTLMTNTTLGMVLMPRLPDDYEAAAKKVEQDALGLQLIWGDRDGLLDYEPSLFTGTAHLAIYRAIEAVTAKEEVLDIVTVSEELERAGTLADVGGLVYLGQIVKHSPRLTPYQISQVVRGYALARYAMVDQRDTEKVAVRFQQAIEGGWAHGRAWRATRDETRRLGIEDAPPGTGNDWVCYAFRRTGDHQ